MRPKGSILEGPPLALGEDGGGLVTVAEGKRVEFHRARGSVVRVALTRAPAWLRNARPHDRDLGADGRRQQNQSENESTARHGRDLMPRSERPSNA